MRQLDRVTALLRAVLGPDLIGAYLSGSAVLGGLRPRSDLDVLAVTNRRLDAPQKRAIISGLLPISAGRDAPTPSRRWLEVSVLSQPDVRPWRYPPPMELQYGDWWRTEFEAGKMDVWDDPNPDLTIVIALALRASRPLIGPPIAEVLEPVPMGDVLRATSRTIDDVLRDIEVDTRNVLLTLARAWVTMAEQRFLPKDEAASWAIERLPADLRPVLARARQVYLGGGADRWGDVRAEVRAAADLMAAEIHSASTGS